jgi:hypothetical protein
VASLRDETKSNSTKFLSQVKLLGVYIVEIRKEERNFLSDIETRNAEGLTRRSFLTKTMITLAGLMLDARVSGQQSLSKTYEFINGQWFDGQAFRSKGFYSVGGILTAKKRSKIDSVIDLAGKYVIPPFGEAHNHNLEWSDEETFLHLKRTYLEAGIFYIKNPNNLPRARTPLLDKINIPTSITRYLLTAD